MGVRNKVKHLVILVHTKRFYQFAENQLILQKKVVSKMTSILSIFQYKVTHEMTPKTRKVKTSSDNNHLSILSDHLSGLLKQKCGVRAF